MPSVAVGCRSLGAYVCLLLLQMASEAVSRAASESPGTSAAPLIAASVGPYGACLGDGSEYDGRYIDTGKLKLPTRTAAPFP